MRQATRSVVPVGRGLRDRRGPRSGRAGGDLAGHVVGVSTRPEQHHRAERELERQPAEEQSRSLVGHAAVLLGPAVLTHHGQVDPREVLAVARAPDHARDVQHPAVGEHRLAVLDADHALLGAVDTAGGQVVATDPQHRGAVEADVRHLLASHGRTAGEDVAPGEGDRRPGHPGPSRLDGERDLAAVAAGQRRRVGEGELVRDVGPGVGRPHDEHGPVGELAGTAVLARVQLQDPGVELGSERRDARRTTEGAGRDHDVVAADLAGGGVQQVAVPVPGEPLDADPEPHRQRVVHGVLLEVVGHLVLARARPRLGRERQPRQRVVPGRRVEPQAVPQPSPVVADALVGVEDEAVAAAPLQVVRRGEAGLAGSDDDGLDVFHGSSRCLEEPR